MRAIRWDGSMATLEDVIGTVRELHVLRQETQERYKAAIFAITDHDYKSGRQGWRGPGDQVEQALVVRAIFSARKRRLELGKSDRNVSRTCETLLSDISLGSLSHQPDPATPGALAKLDKVPVLRAARAMQAYATMQGKAFSREAIVCYYRLIRELIIIEAKRGEPNDRSG